MPLASLLDEHQISYEIDDTAVRFSVTSFSNSELNPVLLKIYKSDEEQVKKLLADHSFNIENVHFLYSFSDTDIIDVIANPNEWTIEEQRIAQQIVGERGIKISADDIKNARQTAQQLKKEEKEISASKKIEGYPWFLTIAVFSVINALLAYFEVNLRFVFGLGLTELFTAVFANSFGSNLFVFLSVSCLFAGLFVLIWFFSKQGNTWAYLLGLILYGLDALLIVYFKDWLAFAFHVFAFIGLFVGFMNLLEAKKQTT